MTLKVVALRGPLGTLAALRRSLERLRQHGHVMLQADWVRSRMAELARELRLAKQRFRVGDQDRRPFLVRAIKVLAERREKPKRDRDLAPVLTRLAEQWREDAHVTAVLQGIPETLRRGLKLDKSVEPSISGFQERSLAALLPAWLGEEGPTAFVLTADTGAGKTEAGVLPLLAGAAIDRLRGIEGTRAVLVYPRIRLAVNQSERLVGYAKALGDVLGSRLTVGLQSRDVPRDWQAASWADSDKSQEQLWVREEGRSGWRFPFFNCPGCDAPLRLEPGSADADRLICDAAGCGWRFDGWVGTKNGLRQAPPALLILVTESLHQWMQDPSASAIFGDHHITMGGGNTRTHAPPRALLADEIHLYSHVHGAQVGWMLQRFLARCRLNGEPRPLAIGMSATLGEAARVWGDLCGRAAEDVHHIGPREGERGDNPRGREYFYFVQPEVESRNKDVAGAATTIQSLMLLAHGMRRRTGGEGGFRGLAFFDSIDKLKRLHTDFTDAEMRKNLAALRTRDYGADPQDPTHLRTSCCGEPRSCARFRVGECWYFAATDFRQVRAGGNRLEPGAALTVAPRPVSSATAGNVDKMLERSDLVFATSSLEVGYDDPDMMLVYQHYAPANLASFVQRKGRGGRGMDDRPVTGVTLSIHSPRDSWYFRHPARMLQAANFRVPVNMSNVFVRRGQVLSALLDIAARHAAWTNWKPTPQLPPSILSTADAFVREAFGDAVYQELEEESLQALWARVCKNATPPLASGQSLREWREAIVEVPSLLFDPINLPVLRIVRGQGNRGNEPSQTEDVALALAECAPGRVTLRWGVGDAHWFPPGGARSPWFTSAESQFQTFSLDPKATDEEVARLIPEEVRKAVGGRFSPRILRPTRVKPYRAGTFQGSSWTSTWVWDDTNKKAIEGNLGGVPIHHKTQGTLQGFVVAAQERPPAQLPFAVLRAFTDGQLHVYRSTPEEPRTGLRVTIAHWCSDVEVVLDTPKRDRVYHRQVFLSPEDGQTPQFVGYGFQPEGICLAVDSKRLDAFLERELLELEKDEPRSRWHHGQFLRYLVMTRSSQIGLNRFEARQLADLCITAAAVPNLCDELSKAVERRNLVRLGDVLTQAWQRHLTAHPQLTALRVARLMKRLKTTSQLETALKSAFDDLKKNSGRLRGYLRSVLLQGLLIRLQHLFVIYGLTDENRVVGHARLPLQYDTHADDLLTVCERGSGGDGTTRTFVERAGEVFQQWREERFLSCPNAEADRAVERAFQMTDRHGLWRAKEPRDPEWVRQLASELDLEPEKDSTALQGVLSLLYGGEELQGQRFELFELFGQVRTTRLMLARELSREPTDWELVGTVVGKAVQGLPEVSRWRELLTAYQGVEDALSEGSLSPEARLAEQVYRLSARLCVDGCPACLHLGSDLMDDQLAEASTSRTLLERFGSFVFGQT
ncbi:DEAD/DEAH box helicase [Cystobacter fuscus]|uniref:DEAD/DEAH box helicase n=1 Tax=Cystobacter fuscus TaxID=43 RepID=UPI002B305BDF|nr:DEAD/DEAH box helicase [Cystobacter fuscus]